MINVITFLATKKSLPEILKLVIVMILLVTKKYIISHLSAGESYMTLVNLNFVPFENHAVHAGDNGLEPRGGGYLEAL